jgi:hypothetical protein
VRGGMSHYIEGQGERSHCFSVLTCYIKALPQEGGKDEVLLQVLVHVTASFASSPAKHWLGIQLHAIMNGSTTGTALYPAASQWRESRGSQHNLAAW